MICNIRINYFNRCYLRQQAEWQVNNIHLMCMPVTWEQLSIHVIYLYLYLQSSGN